MRFEPTGGVLGARVMGLDCARPPSARDFGDILWGLGEYGLLCFPGQKLGAEALRDFSAPFGTIQTSVTGKFHHRDAAEVGILSNITENGQAIGIADAGQDWHTDMSYRQTRGFLNVLNGHRVPVRDGRVLGATLFQDMKAAYDTLDPVLKARLRGAVAVHDFNKFWEEMRRRPGSARPPLTPEQRATRPPARHEIFLRHPVSGRTVLYCNPGYAEYIEGMDAAESARILAQLFAHQLDPRFRYEHVWAEGDLLMWDNLSTIHMAVPDYTAEEKRLMLRCQVMADKVFQRGWAEAALAARAA